MLYAYHNKYIYYKHIHVLHPTMYMYIPLLFPNRKIGKLWASRASVYIKTTDKTLRK